jgi:hypothetical protein
MEVSGQLCVPAALSPKKKVIHRYSKGDRVDPKSVLNTEEKKKIFCP